MSLKRKTELMRLRFEKVMNSRVYKEPLARINDCYLRIDRCMKSIENSSIKKLKDCKLEAAKAITKLDALSPLKTLTRGYCLTESDGKVITKAKELKTGMEVDLRFQDGNAKAKVI